jgi:hypothetical protein
MSVWMIGELEGKRESSFVYWRSLLLISEVLFSGTCILSEACVFVFFRCAGCDRTGTSIAIRYQQQQPKCCSF